MHKRVLLTGINGFVGHWLARELKGRGLDVVGIGMQPEANNEIAKDIHEYYECDLTDPRAVSSLSLENISAVVNLAGLAKVGDSAGKLKQYVDINVGVHEVLYKRFLELGLNPRIIAVSTGAVYDTSQNMPLSETSGLVEDGQTNEYVISKKLMEEAVIGLTKDGLDCVIVRPFNHVGPGQLQGFLVPDLAEQIEIAKQTKSPIKVGNLGTKRDYTDVRDVVRAYADLATKPREVIKNRIYNVCSGVSIPGKEILTSLLNNFGYSGAKVETDPSRLRRNDVADIYGSYEKLKTDIGWEPIIPLHTTLKDFADWKSKES